MRLKEGMTIRDRDGDTGVVCQVINDQEIRIRWITVNLSPAYPGTIGYIYDPNDFRKLHILTPLERMMK